jgi:subtilisin family serine protease
MPNRILDQLSATGAAQVLVVLKDGAPAARGKASAALTAAVPVAASRAFAGLGESVVMGLAEHFRTSEVSEDTALATVMAAHRRKSAGATWFKHAKVVADPIPPARYFPHLGMMLGTIDKKGFDGLSADARVRRVLAPPVLSLIRPVRVAPTKPKAAAARTAWGVKRLKADQLHAQGFKGGGIIVGHLDTGADGKHPALKAAFHSFAEFDELGFQVTPTPAPHDTDEHGTHTAGTIAGRTSAGRAIGVAPEALLASAIVIEGGNATARILAGMDWVIGQGARVLSMSLGFRGFHEDFLVVTQTLRDRGILPVFAVGNEGPGTSRSPGNYAEALSVGAMGANDHVADFSSSQVFSRPDNPLVPDVVAPGVAIVSAKPGGGFQEMDGSSMATPHIAGLAALLMQAAPNAAIDQIETAIFDSCAVLAGELSDRQNRGVPDAVKALQLLGVAPPSAGKVSRPARPVHKGGKKGKARRRRAS